jgi:hypothetical protein
MVSSSPKIRDGGRAFGNEINRPLDHLVIHAFRDDPALVVRVGDVGNKLTFVECSGARDRLSLINACHAVIWDR